MTQYYVQDIAGNYLKNVVDTPTQLKADKYFLHGADEEELQSGYFELQSVIKSLYKDIMLSPKEFDMLMKENTVPNAKNAEYTQSHASFLRVPNLLLLLGYKGELQSDMTITIHGNTFLNGAKELKITKPQFFLKKLEDYGFETEGASKTIQAGDILKISYPQNRFMLTALTSMAESMMNILGNDLKKQKNHFYMMDYRLMESEKPKEPKLTFEHVHHALTDEQKKLAMSLNHFIVQYAKPVVRMGGLSRNDWTCAYQLNSNKRVILSLIVKQDELSVKLNLEHIRQYIDSVQQYPKEIGEAIKSGGWECGHCHSNCAGAFTFEYEGKTYNKCRCGSFEFAHLKDDTLHYYIELLEKEIKAWA
ncbi:MAG: hypothetical protein KBA53_04375 [Thermoclostridium sp.]|nr:hypothetical protein [Thermoclostridium sp.]